MGYYEDIAERIYKVMRERQEMLLSPQPHEDLLQLAREIPNKEKRHKMTTHSRRALGAAFRVAGAESKDLYDIYKRSLLLDATDFYEEFMLYMESERPVEERFYQTRRSALQPIALSIQDLIDDRLDEVLNTLPPRIGKTTLIAFLLAWLIGKRPDHPNLYVSYSDTITMGMYNAVLELMTDDKTYRYADVFPNALTMKTNAAMETIDVGTVKHHYPSLTCRSIDGTLNGACDVEGGFAIGDDLVSGIEEALNKDRLQRKQAKVANDFLSRAKETTKLLWIGTRWSVLDPLAARIDLLENGESFRARRYKIFAIPALNDKDESNFDYPYKKGFSTATYHQMRENFERNDDMASWQAVYMGQPIERDGTLFSAKDFRYYGEAMPKQPPERIFMAVDPAFGGGDFVAAPICYQYSNGDLYVPDVVYNNGDKRITTKDIARKAKKWNVSVIQIEANRSTEAYAQALQEELATIDCSACVTTKQSASMSSKAYRIWEKAPDIRERFVFRQASHRSNEYTKFMLNVYAYSPYLAKQNLRKQHDDAPDALAQAIEMATQATRTAHVIKRPW